MESIGIIRGLYYKGYRGSRVYICRVQGLRFKLPGFRVCRV